VLRALVLRRMPRLTRQSLPPARSTCLICD
jgi:hypothetical protein